MEIDQALLESLPLQQRIRICKKLRQKQVKQYNERNQSDGSTNHVRKENRKKTRINFCPDARISYAVSQFDDREGKFSYNISY